MTDVDVQTVALLHGELDPNAARQLRRQLAADPELAAEFEALRAADAALAQLLDQPERAPARRSLGWHGWLAAAALLTTVWLAVRPEGASPTAHNDVVGVTVRPNGGVLQPVFTETALELAWQNRLPAEDRWRLEVLPYHLDESLEAVGRRVADAAVRERFVPLVVSALVHTPAGQRLDARLAAPMASVPLAKHLQIELLRSFEVANPAPPPHLGGRPGDDRWLEEFDWAGRHLPPDGPRRLLLDEPGIWTIELNVHSVPPPVPGAWPVFATPLLVATTLQATGLCSDWGPAVDGMQARLVLATGCVDLDQAPLALQMRNVGDRARHYQFVGRGDPSIPQPFHLRLLRQRGGEAVARDLGEQRQDLAVTIPVQQPEVLQAPGTVRSLVVAASYWRQARDQQVLDGNPAGTRVFAEFHFDPSAWHDLELWKGRLTTGGLELPRPVRR